MMGALKGPAFVCCVVYKYSTPDGDKYAIQASNYIHLLTNTRIVVSHFRMTCGKLHENYLKNETE